MDALASKPWTVERFLAWEDQQEGRHEFDGNGIIKVTGGSRNHQRIVFNLLVALTRLLDANRFDVVQDIRTRLAGQVRYPDVLVHPGRIPGRLRTVADAVALFEVLSDDTADIDLRDKPLAYTALPSLRSYAVVEQDAPGVVLLSRPDAETQWTRRRIAAGAIPLPELGIELELSDVYAGLTF